MYASFGKIKYVTFVVYLFKLFFVSIFLCKHFAFQYILAYITEISKVLTARLGIQNAQSHLINCFQNSLKSRGQKSWSFWSRDFVVFQCATYDV